MQMMHLPRVADPPTANSVLCFLWLHRDGWLRPAPAMASIHPMNRTTWEMYDDLPDPRLVIRWQSMRVPHLMLGAEKGSFSSHASSPSAV
ncbi:hypothetical protein ACQJBY_037886 [Aegilops geniculata]